jgi:hypothetical protein
VAHIEHEITECPKCGSDDLYDNREKKAEGEFSPKSPDFKCKACDEAFWLERKGGNAKGKGKFSSPPKKKEPRFTWITLQGQYWRCLSIAKAQVQKALPDASAAEIIAAAATLWIAVNQYGVEDRRPQPLDEKPKAVDQEETYQHEDLPF